MAGITGAETTGAATTGVATGDPEGAVDAATATGNTTEAVGMVAVAVVGDVAEEVTVPAAAAAVRPLVITPLAAAAAAAAAATAEAVGNGDGEAGINISKEVTGFELI